MNITHFEKPFLSIIVPVYNVEKYLKECLDSLIHQNISENEYEIICIDDGSPDGCPAILDEYEKTYSNFVIVHQRNMGVSSARNNGLDIARGEYVWFVDPDDFVVYNVLLGILDSIKTDYPDVLLANQIAIRDGIDTSRIKLGEKPKKSEIVRENLQWIQTWFFKKEVIIFSGIRFQAGIMIEGNLFVETLKPYIKTIKRYDELVYCYRIRENSLCTTPTIKKLNIMIKTCKTYLQTFKNGTVELKFAMATIYPLLISIMNCLSQLPIKEAKPYIQELKRVGLYPSKLVLEYYKKYKKNEETKKMSITQRLRRVSYTRKGYRLLRLWQLFRKIIPS